MRAVLEALLSNDIPSFLANERGPDSRPILLAETEKGGVILDRVGTIEGFYRCL